MSSGASPTGPGSAQASKSGDFQTLTRVCPESLLSSPPFDATWAAMQMAPQFFECSKSSVQSKFPVGESSLES